MSKLALASIFNRLAALGLLLCLITLAQGSRSIAGATTFWAAVNELKPGAFLMGHFENHDLSTGYAVSFLFYLTWVYNPSKVR